MKTYIKQGLEPALNELARLMGSSMYFEVTPLPDDEYEFRIKDEPRSAQPQEQRLLVISAKCSDMFWGRLLVGKKEIGEYSGYVPKFFPGEHYGDYVELHIDIDTGRIVNWKVPKAKDLTIFEEDS